MKKIISLAAMVLALASCQKSGLLQPGTNGNGSESVIQFVRLDKNSVKSVTDMQKTGHYNFGVFAYKSTDKVNNIMADYLVGYNNDAKGYSKSNTSTWGDEDGNFDGKSYWMYEGMGHAEYNGTYAGQTVTPGSEFASNVANQYLRYWDNSAEYTAFYAYAPYINSGVPGSVDASVVSYVDGQAVGSASNTDTYVMTIPNGTIKHGYDKADEFEFMYAWTKVEKANYGHDVPLEFKRLNAKVNIKFWEDIPGYSVRIIDLNSEYSISAVPAIKDGESNNYGYKLGKIYSMNGAKIQFYPATSAAPTMKQYAGTTVSAPIKFSAPADDKIGTTRVEATPSATTYYAIPKGSSDAVLTNDAANIGVTGPVDGDLAETGLTFHVSYELISTTGEVITVKDATVHVPAGDYTNWKANTHYTYIFKITSNSNGTTDNTIAPKPTDPEVPTEPALYPIVFDNCTVVDWEDSTSEWEITDGVALSYHNITLSDYSVIDGNAHNITVTIAKDDKNLNHDVDYSKITVSAPDASDVTSWYTVGTKTIAVPADAASGVYTVTYTCPSSDVYTTHPKTWTTHFVVGHAYGVTTSLDEIGTNGNAATKLTIKTSIDGGALAQPSAATGLSVEYPGNAVDDKVKVEVVGGYAYVTVAKNATPGKYKLIYTNNYAVDGGEVVPVKVAEKVFEVKDYSFTLSTYAVKLGADPVAIDASCPTTGVISMTTATGITVDDSAKTISVANTAAEGTYTVTYTVQGSTVSEVQYQKTFTVANTYAVTLSKNTLNTTVGAANDAEYGSDYIVVTSAKNGVTNTPSSELVGKYTITGLAADTYRFVFVPAVAGSGTPGDPGYVAPVPAYIKLQVKKSVVAGSYTVVYTGQSTPDTKTASASFVIQK